MKSLTPLPRLGRIHQPDERNANFPVRAVLNMGLVPRSYTWRCTTWLDQGQTSSCVGHSWAHEVAARPKELPADSELAFGLYRLAQQLDEWPGEEPAYFGSSVLGGAKAAQRLGFVERYHWATTVDELKMAVGYRGPAILGTNWHEGMFRPDPQGVIEPSGPVAGGHAYLVNGVSVKLKMFRIHNSWGRTWGLGGDAFISFDSMAHLLWAQGEACVPDVRTAPPVR